MVEGIETAHGSLDLEGLVKEKPIAACVISSTLTSTIPNISLAGEISIATLFTPALDVEYVFHGKPMSIDIIPTTPSGIPTPALITRVALQLSGIPFIAVDSGSYIEPRIPFIALPSRRVGGKINEEEALPRGTSRKLFLEAKSLGKVLGSLSRVVMVGESMPGGTTTALSILRALGIGDYNSTSSSSNINPVDIKKKVVERALERARGVSDPFEINDIAGDPLHISVAGMAVGILSANSYAILAGGTQMLAALALMKSSGESFNEERVAIATTRWVYEDRGEEMVKIVKRISPGSSILYINLNFSDSPFEGLRAFEKGFVKEGAGAGGASMLAISRGVSMEGLKASIYKEYESLIERK
ncbi:MAG: nicotinate mononucleotide-dependent phosphoribosyltransferase CobT [Fervidicoccaceae archaeon]